MLRGASEIGTLLRVGTDGVAGGDGKVRRELVKAEPADFASFYRLAICGFTRKDLSKESRGDPMLVFTREAMVGDAEERAKGDFEADLFAGFANGARFERF
jgi:hypothetical protein